MAFDTGITYIPMQRGFIYLVTVLDWFCRYVPSWRLSNPLDANFCLDALEDALAKQVPQVLDMDGKGRFIRRTTSLNQIQFEVTLKQTD